MVEPSDRSLSDGDRAGPNVEAVAQRLREEGAGVVARLATMTKELESFFAASVDSNADDEHDTEGQTIAYERSQLSALIRAAEEHLSSIETATVRLEQGGYGTCEVCLQPIPAARLAAPPPPERVFSTPPPAGAEPARTGGAMSRRAVRGMALPTGRGA